MKTTSIPLIGAFAMLLLSSCYRMPTDDDYSVVPTTNNPSVTHEKPVSLVPGVGM